MSLYVRDMVVHWVGKTLIEVHTEDDINIRAYMHKLPEDVKFNKGDKICCAFIDKSGFDSINMDHVFMIQIHRTNAEGKPTVQTLFRDNVEKKYRFLPNGIDGLLVELIYQIIRDAAITVVSNRSSIPKDELDRILFLHKRPERYCWVNPGR